MSDMVSDGNVPFELRSAKSLVEAKNTVSFSQGDTVCSTSDVLSGLNVINTSSVPVTGLAFAASVPEPSTIVLMLSGAVALAGRWLHRRRTWALSRDN